MAIIDYLGGMGMVPFTNPLFYSVFFVVIAWSAIWKGIALWKCGRNNQLAWFVVLLVVNTLGILEIIYLLFFQAERRVKKKRR